MNRAQVDRQDQHDPEERYAEEQHAWSRRALFGTAGGFALARSGLLIPDWLVEEAEAGDQHPVRSVQERQERKRRKRGHDHRKRHRAASKKRGSGKIFRDVAIHVYNNRYYGSVQVQGWVGRFEYNNQMDPYYMPSKDWDWTTLSAAGQSVGPTSRAFIGDDEFVAVRIGTDRIVTGLNHWFDWPEAAILSGGWDAKQGWSPVGQTLASESRMEVNRSISASGIKVTRADDTEGHIVFKVDLT